MIAPLPLQRTEGSSRQAVRQALSLALGNALGSSHDTDWPLVFQVCVTERIAGLAWKRAGHIVRDNAPIAVIEQWRAHAMRVALQVEELIAAVAGAVVALRAVGVSPVVLKGPPLSQRLYGDATIRPLADCDLYIAAADRDAASAALFAAGWTSRVGEAPSEETFERWSGGQRNVIEVHSSVVDDPLLSHLRIPLQQSDVRLGAWTLPAQSGEYVLASLAAHLAKHETAPLLWIIDYHTLWESLDQRERASALTAAGRAGLSRHVRWALQLAADVPAAAGGSQTALDRLSVLRRATGDLGRVRRLLKLSQNPFDALRVLSGRIWPAEYRDDLLRFPAYLLRRAAGWLARRTGLLVSGQGNTSAARALPVDEAALTALLEETLGRGLAVWIRPRGTSMAPAIPPAAQAHIVPLSSRRLHAGDVVLARLRHGQFLLHRVVRVFEDQIQLKGDAMRRRDDIVPLSAVIGVCDMVEVDGLMYNVEDRPRDNVALLAAETRKRLSRFFQRGA